MRNAAEQLQAVARWRAVPPINRTLENPTRLVILAQISPGACLNNDHFDS